MVSKLAYLWCELREDGKIKEHGWRAGISRGGRFDRRVLSRGILVGMIRLMDSDGTGEVCFATQAASLDGRKSFFFLSWDVSRKDKLEAPQENQSHGVGKTLNYHSEFNADFS